MKPPINTLLNCRDRAGRAFMGMLTKLGWVEVNGKQRKLADPPASWAETHTTDEYRFGTDPWWIRREIQRAKIFNS